MFKVVILAILGISWCNAQHGHHGASSYSTLALGHGGYGGYGGYGHGGYAGGYGGGFGHGYGGHGHFAIAAPVAVHAAPVAVHAVHAAPVAYAPAHHGHGHHVDYYAHPKYEFKYGVSDAHTGDHHQQHEVRDGDVVHGEYSLHEADGTIRIVKYTADHKNGFNAQVIRQGHAAHPTHVGHKAVVAAVPVHHAITYGGHGHGGHY